MKPTHVNKVKLFICDLNVPIFSLKIHGKRSIEPLGITSANGLLNIDVTPSALGIPTQFDKDLLIYVMGLALQNGKRIVSFTLYDYLLETGKDTGGASYKRAKDSLLCLSTTFLRIKDLPKENQECHIIETAILTQKTDTNSQNCIIEISDWIFDTITLNKPLSINPLYFKLKKTTERILYELASKYCGNSKFFKISTPSLVREIGIKGPLKECRRVLKTVFNEDNIPDYRFTINNDDLVTIRCINPRS